MSEHVRGSLLTSFLLLFGGAAFEGGRLADVSMRDPAAFATMCLLIVSFLAVLILASPLGRYRP